MPTVSPDPILVRKLLVAMRSEPSEEGWEGWVSVSQLSEALNKPKESIRKLIRQLDGDGWAIQRDFQLRKNDWGIGTRCPVMKITPPPTDTE